MKLKFKHAVGTLLAVGMLLSNTAQAAPSYRVTDLGTLGGNNSYARGINASGQVVGSSNTATAGSAHAFSYSGGRMTDLGTLGGNNSYASDINASGQVVGSAETAGGNRRAFLYSDGRMTDLGTLGGTLSYATAINDRGQVVGGADTDNVATSDHHAFLYSGGRMTDLGTLGGGNGQSYSYANDINNSGQIVGGADINTDGPDRAGHAFLYSGDVMTDLGTLGGRHSYASAINDLGQIVGRAETPIDSQPPYVEPAFLYSGGRMINLGTLKIDVSRDNFATGLDINNRGQIVGFSVTFDDPYGTAFFYSDGRMTDLNSLIDPLAVGWRLSSADGINDLGQIAGTMCRGSFRTNDTTCHAVLLSPVPEPGIYLMMLAGLGLLGMKVRRRNSSL